MKTTADQPAAVSRLDELKDEDHMTPADLGRLAELEDQIKKGLHTFIEVGTALAEIRYKRLYRETHRTFEAYCDERWEMSISHAKRQMEAAEVAAILAPIGAVSNEGQAREFVPLLGDPAAMMEVYQDLQEVPGAKRTAAIIHKAVEQKMRGQRTPWYLRKRKPTRTDCPGQWLGVDCNRLLTIAELRNQFPASEVREYRPELAEPSQEVIDLLTELREHHREIAARALAVSELDEEIAALRETLANDTHLDRYIVWLNRMETRYDRVAWISHYRQWRRGLRAVPRPPSGRAEWIRDTVTYLEILDSEAKELGFVDGPEALLAAVAQRQEMKTSLAAKKKERTALLPKRKMSRTQRRRTIGRAVGLFAAALGETIMIQREAARARLEAQGRANREPMPQILEAETKVRKRKYARHANNGHKPALVKPTRKT